MDQDLEADDAGDDEDVSPGEPLWLKFEKDVSEFIAEADPNATVEHNVKRPGLSGRTRQMDAMATGCVGTVEVEVGFECKRYSTRTVGIGAVDAFVGKCMDMGVSYGVLYSFGGFDSGAVARAAIASNPTIELRDVSHHALVQPWEEIIPEFLGTVRCPVEDCWGQVWISTDESSDWFGGGQCDSCGSTIGECQECGEVTHLEDSQLCIGCDAYFEVDFDYNSQIDTGVRWMPVAPSH